MKRSEAEMDQESCLEGIQNYKRHAGGFHQRAAAWSTSSSSAGTHQLGSALVTTLVQDFCFGSLDASQVQHYCWAAVQDGATHPLVKRIAGLGNSGACPGNVNKQLRTLLNKM
eukprot:432612-Alexandrium_andersonii.AAC.1